MLKLRHPWSLLAIFFLVMLGVLRTFSVPAPVESDVPEVVFSAVRAEAILRDLLQEGKPHPAGSELNAVVRDRIIGHLKASGYDPRVQSRFQCNPRFGSCSSVDNVIAVKPGTEGRYALLLTAHYDSGWTGPGAADDGAAVAAILEIADMASDFPPFRNDIVFLFTDAEEVGLVGARAFAEHDPLFSKVKAVINLEARGVSGPSALFETGEGNRSVVRMFAKNVERPVGNSLVYEMYKRMPNDTDYSVYRDRGVMGLNFAFARGVAVYHSSIDDLNHLDLGSLQHHGDNAWAMVKAVGERDLSGIRSRENAGFIDVFGMWLVHYPVAITGGLALFLGVWVMIAIGLAFRREFRFRQLRWGLLAIPFLIAFMALGGAMMSFPLGHWVDIHPIEYPYPWAGRLALFAVALLAIYVTLRLFSGRVSACAWMILAWFLVFMLALVLSSKLPTASHLALVPLAMFALGSLVDLVRKKSPAPLLVASVLGFAASSFISLYHFFMLDTVMNFDMAYVKTLALAPAVLVAMPMLLAWASKRELDWRPAKGLAGALLLLTVVHWILPAFTAERPRDMTLMYRETEGNDTAHLILESISGRHDPDFADSHDFEVTKLETGRLDTAERPARAVRALDLPAVVLTAERERTQYDTVMHRLVFELPADTPLLEISVPLDIGLQSAWVDGERALDTRLQTKHRRQRHSIRLIHPPAGSVRVDLETVSERAFSIDVLTWHELPGVLIAPFLGNWPDEARPYLYGPRAEKHQSFEIGPDGGLSSDH